ncbi:hypothetical protein HII31_10658 [Pseudocercospora fuligena]|uniref:Uncharacterized protein n=1 Tax=Pseudocercospora fuligena TaxID=685502 RepID=A0A8H6RDD8_9PEZI|nr:hypothetical protein HII31_10658 [Pseudocercospora fuligena]
MPDFQEHLAYQAERKLYTAIENGGAWSMSIDVPLPLVTSQRSKQEKDELSEQIINHVDPEIVPAEHQSITQPQLDFSDDSEQDPRQIDWRLSGLNAAIASSRDWAWSEEYGDVVFDGGCEEWRRKTLAALEGCLIVDRSDDPSSSSEAGFLSSKDEESKVQIQQEASNDDNSVAGSASKGLTTTNEQDFLDQNDELEVVASHVFVSEPEWVQDYNERQPPTPKTPERPSFHDEGQIYEAYSPEKLRIPPKMRFAHERDLLDLPELDQQATERSADLAERSHLTALQSPERLLFLPDKYDGADAGSEDSFISASETPFVETLVDGTGVNGEVSSGNDEGTDLITEQNMLFVAILRDIVAAIGGLAALPDAIGDTDDEGDEDDISDFELDDEY